MLFVYEIGVFKGQSQTKIEIEKNIWIFSYILDFLSTIIKFFYKINEFLSDLLGFI